MSYIPKFQIGNETVTIFRRWACPTLTAVCLPNFRVQRYGFLLKLANHLIINIFGLVQGASYIYKYILAPCTKNFVI